MIACFDTVNTSRNQFDNFNDAGDQQQTFFSTICGQRFCYVDSGNCGIVMAKLAAGRE